MRVGESEGTCGCERERMYVCEERKRSTGPAKHLPVEQQQAENLALRLGALASGEHGQRLFGDAAGLKDTREFMGDAVHGGANQVELTAYGAGAISLNTAT